MHKDTLNLPKKHVVALGASKAQWALKRVHCANLSPEKRGYWEKIIAKWVMLPDPETVVPDLDVLDQLSMKHLPVSWDVIMVKLLECAPEDFKGLTGLDRGRTNLLQWVKCMALIFNACEAAVVQLQDYGFYERPDKRKRGETPRLAKDYLAYEGAYDVFEFGRAIVWMVTPDGPKTRPFWWALGEKAFANVKDTAVYDSIRDRLTLA